MAITSRLREQSRGERVCTVVRDALSAGRCIRRRQKRCRSLGASRVVIDVEHPLSGLIYLPNGTVKSVRDVNRMVDPNTRVSHVYERDDQGGWKQVREWTWKQLTVGDQ